MRRRRRRRGENPVAPLISLQAPLIVQRTLPPRIVSVHVYPFAVRVLKNREELIKAVDEYIEAKQKGRLILYPINEWDVSGVTSFADVFSAWCKRRMAKFDEDLSEWDVSKGTDFTRMFHGCSEFNSDLSRWNVSNGTFFGCMFYYCQAFNSDLSRWNVTNGTDFRGMFSYCHFFNCDLSSWNVPDGADFTFMFYGCTMFHCDLSSWNLPDNVHIGLKVHRSSFDGFFRG